MGKRRENLVEVEDVQYLRYYTKGLSVQKRFNETDEKFIELGERICFEHFKGLRTPYSLFALNTISHDTYDAFRFKGSKSASSIEQERYLIEQLHKELQEVEEGCPSFESTLNVLDEKVMPFLDMLLTNHEFAKTMTSITRSIKEKIGTELDRLTKDESNYGKPAQPEVVGVCKILLDLDRDNYKRRNQDEIDLAIDQAKVDLEKMIGPMNEKRYSLASYGELLNTALDQAAFLYEKAYFETPETWVKRRTVRW